MPQAEVVEQESAPGAARQETPPSTAREGRQGQPASPRAEPPAPAAKKGMSPRFRMFAIAAALVLVVAGVLYWLHARQYEDTDDAQVDGHIHPISARVNGTVQTVNPQVEENRYVAAGTVLVTIDPADYEAAAASANAEVARLRDNAAASSAAVPVETANAVGQLDLARAALAQAEQAVVTEIGNLNAAKARAGETQSNAAKTEADRKRYANLLDKQEISRSEYDQRANDARTAQGAFDASQADVTAAEARVAQARDSVAQQRANLSKARTAPQQIAQVKARSGSANADLAKASAQLDTARLNLSYTRIVAPVSGLVGRKNVESGQRVQPGQELLTIVQLDDVWITANFKETQLQLMRPGQPAQVHVDAYGMDLPAHVESIAAATGSRFSLLPPENASGNFVKVVQRVPVRLRLDHPPDANHPLLPGLSVDARVTVR